MQRLLILEMLKVNIGNIILILLIIEKVLDGSNLFLAHSDNQILISLKLDVPPVLPRALI
jgi:hypothetical protein